MSIGGFLKPFCRFCLFLVAAALLPACGVDGGGTLTPTVAPGAPTSLQTKSGNGRILVTWDSSPAATSYNIRRSLLSGGPYGPIPSGQGVPGTSFVDAPVSNGSSYSVVSAVKAQNQSAEVGDGSLQGTYSPVPVATFSTAVQVSAGGFHGLALLGDGSVRAWGDNFAGQIGIGSNSISVIPILVTR